MVATTSSASSSTAAAPASTPSSNATNASCILHSIRPSRLLHPLPVSSEPSSEASSATYQPPLPTIISPLTAIPTMTGSTGSLSAVNDSSAVLLSSNSATASATAASSASATASTAAAATPTVLKLLFTNSAAGVVIGQGGRSRDLIQRKSGVRMQFSKPGEYFEGTSERILVLIGSFHSIMLAMSIILRMLSMRRLPAQQQRKLLLAQQQRKLLLAQQQQHTSSEQAVLADLPSAAVTTHLAVTCHHGYNYHVEDVISANVVAEDEAGVDSANVAEDEAAGVDSANVADEDEGDDVVYDVISEIIQDYRQDSYSSHLNASNPTSNKDHDINTTDSTDSCGGGSSNDSGTIMMLRIVMPAAAVGAVLGKGGCVTQNIRKVTGVNMSISSQQQQQQEQDQAHYRIITITTAHHHYSIGNLREPLLEAAAPLMKAALSVAVQPLSVGRGSSSHGSPAVEDSTADVATERADDESDESHESEHELIDESCIPLLADESRSILSSATTSATSTTSTSSATSSPALSTLPLPDSTASTARLYYAQTPILPSTTVPAVLVPRQLPETARTESQLPASKHYSFSFAGDDCINDPLDPLEVLEAAAVAADSSQDLLQDDLNEPTEPVAVASGGNHLKQFDDRSSSSSGSRHPKPRLTMDQQVDDEASESDIVIAVSSGSRAAARCYSRLLHALSLVMQHVIHSPHYYTVPSMYSVETSRMKDCMDNSSKQQSIAGGSSCNDSGGTAAACPGPQRDIMSSSNTHRASPPYGRHPQPQDGCRHNAGTTTTRINLNLSDQQQQQRATASTRPRISPLAEHQASSQLLLKAPLPSPFPASQLAQHHIHVIHDPTHQPRSPPPRPPTAAAAAARHQQSHCGHSSRSSYPQRRPAAAAISHHVAAVTCMPHHMATATGVIAHEPVHQSNYPPANPWLHSHYSHYPHYHYAAGFMMRQMMRPPYCHPYFLPDSSDYGMMLTSSIMPPPHNYWAARHYNDHHGMMSAAFSTAAACSCPGFQGRDDCSSRRVSIRAASITSSDHYSLYNRSYQSTVPPSSGSSSSSGRGHPTAAAVTYNNNGHAHISGGRQRQERGW